MKTTITTRTPETKSEKIIAEKTIIDGNQAAVHIAYKTSEVCAIYPITPSSAMGEWADECSSDRKQNIFGEVPKIIKTQSETAQQAQFMHYRAAPWHLKIIIRKKQLNFSLRQTMACVNAGKELKR
jgi:hypothetical protein